MSKNFQLERETSSLSSFPDTKSFFSQLKSWLLPYAFLSPTLVVVTLFFFIPLVMVFILSFTNLDMTNFGILKWWQPVNWTLDNYTKIFTNRFFLKILNNTFIYVSMTLVFFNVGMALVIALIKALAGPAPMGVINKHILGPLGIGAGEYLLNTNPWLLIILVNGFIGASFGMIIFSSAIEAIPKDYMIASKVDGASTWQTIRYITIPMIRWPLLFVTTYQTLSLLTSFEYIMLLTDGGPGLYETEVWSLTAYHRALTSYFGNTQWGYGSAWAVILVIIGVVMAIVYLRVFKFDELVQEPKIDQL